MSEASSDPPQLFSHESRRREEIVTRFEEAWFGGDSPDVADYLEADGAARRPLLVELCRAELEFRLKGGEPARVEDYLGRFAELAEDDEMLAVLVGDEYRLRRRSEPHLRAEEFLRRFPQLGDRLPTELNVPDAVAEEVPAGRPASSRVTVEVIGGPHAGEVFVIERHETILIGRAANAQLRLNRDPYFSRYHVRLEIAPPHGLLTDLDSHNGTFVNGGRVRTAELQHGDVISGGRTRIAFTVTDTPENACPDRSRRTACFAQPEGAPRSTASAPVPEIPGYRQLEELGSGTMGRVYRAVQESTGRTVALKVILPAHAASHEATRMFIREARVLSSLDHSGIVRFAEVGLADDIPYLVMDYVPTVSHTEVLGADSGGARIRVACAILCRVLDALHHAHRLSLVHRDIKPANILLSRKGRKLHVKLADFGLAKNYLGAGLSSVIREGDHRGTLAFMPPEQVRDCRHATPACDLYAAGVTLYYYLSDRLPFDFSPGKSAFAAILDEEPVPLDRRCPGLPPELVSAVHRAMAKEPDRRFPNADLMRRALAPFGRRPSNGAERAS